MEKLSEILADMLRSALAWEEENGQPFLDESLICIRTLYTMPPTKTEVEPDEHTNNQQK